MLEHEPNPNQILRQGSHGGFKLPPATDESVWNSRRVMTAITSIDEIILEVQSKQTFDLQKSAKTLQVLKDTIHLTSKNHSSEELQLMIKMEALVDEKLLQLDQEMKASIYQPNFEQQAFIHELEDVLKENQLQLDALVTKSTSETNYRSINLLPGKNEVTEQVFQVGVLNQFNDGTTSGFENCGFHALKNALILTSGLNAEEMSIHLNNQEFFLTFYTLCCAPLLEAKQMGKKDASVPILREILHQLQKDSHMENIHKALKSAPNAVLHDQIAMMQASTTGGASLLGFTDLDQSLDGIKLYQFAKNPGPSTLNLVIGDESMGHWFVLNVSKDAEGTLTFVGCDSMDNHHDTLGMFSSLSKLATVISTNIENPEEFLKKVYEPIGDEISRCAGWFEPDGSIPQERIDELLDDQPNLNLASPHAPTGSRKELILANCLSAFEIMKEGGWLSSSDYWCHLKVNELKRLVDFYVIHLPHDDPNRAKLQEMQKEIEQQIRPNLTEEIFNEALKEVKKFKDTLSPNAYERVSTLFSFMLRILV